jgi:two-component system LytT family sensor kinase
MLLILILTPPEISFSFIADIYPIMLFGSITGIILFTIVIKETKAKMDEENEEQLEIDDIEIKLKEYDEKIEELENEIEELKKEK